MKRTASTALYCILGLLLISCSSGKKEKEEEGSVSTVLPDQVNEVRAMKLTYTNFEHELISNGTVSAVQKADLRFESSQNVARIFVKNGDRVTHGQAIASLDMFKLESALAQAKDNLEKAKLEFQDVLIGQGYSPNDTTKIPRNILSIAKVKSNYDQSNIQYRIAEYNLKNGVLYAPFNGVVANLFSKEHNLPPSSDPFCTIIDNSRPEVVFMVLENELPLIRTGDRVAVSPFAVSDYSSEGQVSEINPAVDKNGMVRIKATISNAQNRLYDGMNVKVKIKRTLGRQLVIPKEALVLRTNKKVVFTLSNGTARWVYVQTGMENSDGYVVTEGLAEGDSVIYEGNINLAHEAPVVVIN